MASFTAGLGTSTLADSGAAVRQAVGTAAAALKGAAPGLAYVTCTVEHPADAVLAALQAALPGVPVHGVTTSLGVLGSSGLVAGPDGAVGVLLMAAGSGVTFGVGSAALGGDAREAGRIAARQVMAAGHGKVPAVLLFNASPGEEEDILAGVADVLPNVPAWGGSAADHAIAGDWSVFTNTGTLKAGVSLAGIFGDVVVGGAFIAPYNVTSRSAKVTASSGRSIAQLDGRPASQVLGELVGEAVSFQVEHGGNILAQTSLRPLALKRSEQHFLTIHPAAITKPGNTVELFARVKQGDTLCLMESKAETLVGALDTLVTVALEDAGMKPSQVTAGILIYCAGCAGAVGPQLDAGLRDHLAGRLQGAPLLGLCTFGEQGHVPGVGNLHQNLTLGLLLLGARG